MTSVLIHAHLRCIILFQIKMACFCYLPWNQEERATCHSLISHILCYAQLIWSLISFSWRNKFRLMDHLSVCVYIPLLILNAWNNINETWYAYRGSWSHPKGVLHKSLSSVCVSECVSPVIVARQWLGNHVLASSTTRKNKRIIRRFIFCSSMSYEIVCGCACLFPYRC
jgi:hypothetical protein